MAIKPLNNMCLIEVIDDYEGVIRNTENENVQKGVFVDYAYVPDHLTASTGYRITDDDLIAEMAELIGKTVYWQELADAGSKFTVEGKRYVLVPFYRLIGYEEEAK